MNKQTYKSHTDEALMALIQKGEAKAFDELYARYSVILLNFFYRKLYQDREKANDFLQDLFLKIIDHPEKFDVKRNFGSWVLKVAYNMCKNEYRKNENKQPEYGLEFCQNIFEISSFQYAYDLQLFHQKLQDALSKMSQKHQETFELRHLEKHSIKEIAVLMDCSEGTVKSRLFYCMKELAEKLKLFKNQPSEYYEK